MTNWAKGDRVIGPRGDHGEIRVVESFGVYFLPDGGTIGQWLTNTRKLTRELPDSGNLPAPWTASQVDRLNRFQREGNMHPFTCPGHDDGDRELVATRSGWICCHCNYRQGWAHPFMLEEPINPLAQIAAERC